MRTHSMMKSVGNNVVSLASRTAKRSKPMRRRTSDAPLENSAQLRRKDNQKHPMRRKEDKITHIGEFCALLLKAGFSTEEILARVKSRFPGCHTSVDSVSWYRSRINRTGTHTGK